MTVADEYAIKDITIDRQSGREERQQALYQIYAQVLERQPYAYERKQLAKDEADFLKSKIGVKRFVRNLSHSEVYLNAFYFNSSNPKFIELCFKHFIGRAPKNAEEMRTYCDILMRQGPKAMLTELLDSEDYRRHFDGFTVPHPWTETTYPSPKTFWETDVLLHELHGQRGWIIPTMVWHDLKLNCDGGHCALESRPSLPSPQTVPPPATPGSHPDGTVLHDMLRAMSPAALDQFAKTLSPEEREKLWAVLVR
jgi:phycoerythrin-associated linker protein